MGLTFAERHGFSEHSVSKDAVLHETFYGVRAAITRMRNRSNLRLTKIFPDEVQLVDGAVWDRTIRQLPENENVVGYYIREEHRCFARYDQQCRRGLITSVERQEALADCASTVSHEMIHHASYGGLNFSQALNEAMTEWLNEDEDITASIQGVVGMAPATYGYEEERKMWSVMRGNEPQTIRRLLRCFWNGDNGGAVDIIRKTFGQQIFKALTLPRRAPEKVMRLMASQSH